MKPGGRLGHADIGLLALFRGITEIVLAFELESPQHR
jgi:hypothetical protein